MSNSWLPTWLGVAASAAFVAVLAVHVWHLVRCTGRARAWHCVHVLMALGMIDMFLPTGRLIMPAGVGEAVFGFAAVTVAGFAVTVWARGGGWIWLIAGVDLAAMVYMFAMSSTRVGWLTWLLVAWFAVEALGWATGRLGGVAASGLGGSRALPAIETAALASVRIDAYARTESVARLGSTYALSIRVTLVVMSVGMAYMLMAMQLGMHTEPGMPGMPRM